MTSCETMACLFFLVLWSVAGGLTPQVSGICRRVGPVKVAAAAAAAAPANEVPRTRLERHFNSKMKNDTVPLFEDFETYVGTLPTRRHRVTAKHYKLCDYPFWAKDEDVDYMVKLLEYNDDDDVVDDPARAFVKYAAAPTSSGKTASALVGFLASAEKYKEETSFTHYLYLAFANNNGTVFKLRKMSRLSQDVDVAEKQGAAFALECLRKRLLDTTSGEKETDLDVDPPLMSETRDALKKLLDDHFPEDARILVHLDEHRDMCWLKSMLDQSAAFRQGFMETIADVERVTVLATYTAMPGEIPSTSSSGTCRYPVPVPPLDLDQVIADVEELRWPTNVTEFNKKEKRLWATLKFRLAAKLTKAGLLGLHLRRFVGFRKKFKEAATGAKTNVEALKACVGLCAVAFGSSTMDDPNAVKLLLGVSDKYRKDSKEDELVRQIGDVVVVRTGSSNQLDQSTTRLTSSLGRLLSINQEMLTAPFDHLHIVYRAGRTRLADVLEKSTDDLSATPLEASYAWTLSCESARTGVLRFATSPLFKIECESLEAGRFFVGDDETKYSAQKLEENVIYYVDERPGTTTHPLGDIFFRTKKNQVVLIDIGGSLTWNEFKKKRNKLRDWIQQEQRNQPELTFHGVVLAPFVSGSSSVDDSLVRDRKSTLTVVRGEDALELLGGLRQLARWLET